MKGHLPDKPRSDERVLRAISLLEKLQAREKIAHMLLVGRQKELVALKKRGAGVFKGLQGAREHLDALEAAVARERSAIEHYEKIIRRREAVARYLQRQLWPFRELTIELGSYHVRLTVEHKPGVGNVPHLNIKHSLATASR